MQVIAKANVLSLKLLTTVFGPCSVNASIGTDKLARCARTKGHGRVHAQSYSDVIDVVDTRSFEVKERKNF
jgi:hypothetical protein